MRVPRLLRPLSRHCGGRRFGEFLRYIVSPNNHVAVKWRHCFNWKARTQNGERLRRKRERNEYGCTFHVPRSYRKQSSDGKVILQNSAAAGGHLPSQHHIMVQASTEVVSQSRSRAMTTRRWRRTKMADSRESVAPGHPRCRWQTKNSP